MEKLKSFTSSSLFLPIVALAVLLIFNGIFVEGFFDSAYVFLTIVLGCLFRRIFYLCKLEDFIYKIRVA